MSITLEELRAELSPIRSRLAAIEPHVAGIPLIHRDLEALRHDVRQIKAAINDLAAVQMTSVFVVCCGDLPKSQIS